MERKAAISCFFGALTYWAGYGESFVVRKDVVEAIRKRGGRKSGYWPAEIYVKT